MLPEIRLHRLGSMVRSEHLRGQTLRRLSQEPVHRLRSYPVEDQIPRLLSICELVKVSSNRTIRTINPQNLLPSDTVLSQKIELYPFRKELDVFNPER